MLHHLVPEEEYSSAEAKECLERDAKQGKADEKMQHVRGFTGIDIEGWVPDGEFGGAKEKANIIKSELAEAADANEERKEFDVY